MIQNIIDNYEKYIVAAFIAYAVFSWVRNQWRSYRGKDDSSKAKGSRSKTFRGSSRTNTSKERYTPPANPYLTQSENADIESPSSSEDEH